MDTLNNAEKNSNCKNEKTNQASVLPNDQEIGWKFWKKRRYIVGILASFGFFTSYMLRVSLSISIVSMTTSSNEKEAEFDWSPEIRGLVLGGFFYGYASTHFVGGWISAKIGGKRVFAIGIGVTAFLTLITPITVRINVYLFIALRVIEGCCEGVTIPCMSAIWANWSPPAERSKLSSLATLGNPLGTVFAMPISAFIAEQFGWPQIFYIYGIFGICWSALWWYFVTDRPEDDPRISQFELNFIKQSLNNSNQKNKISVPWKAIIKSPAVWAIFVADCAGQWGFLTMIAQLPTFMDDVLHFKLQVTGLFSAIPFTAMTISMLVFSYLADYLISNNYLTTTQVRKIFTCVPFTLQAILVILLGFLDSSIAVIVCIVIEVCIGGISPSGYFVNYLEIAPQHASILMGIGHSISSLAGVFSPVLTSYIVRNKTADEWRIVFIAIGINFLVGAIIYGIFASGKKQKWADDSEPVSRH